MDINKELQSIEAEAGVISTLLYNPKYVFHSEQLLPEHFSDSTNAILFDTIRKIALDGATKIDTFNMTKYLNGTLPSVNINELFDLGIYACRESVEEYRLLVKEIQNKALRRDMYTTLQRASKECIQNNTDDIQNTVYSMVEGVSRKFAHTKDLQLFADKVDSLWSEVYDRQQGKVLTTPFHIEALNEYVQIEAGELVLFGGSAKSGKSAMLLSITVDLLNKGQSVLVIDTELSDRLYMLRLISHVSEVEFKTVKDGKGTDEEKQKIDEAKAWIKSVNLYHEYVPVLSDVEVMTLFKRVNAITNIDTLIFDYFKISTLGDAYTVSTTMANTVNVVKNNIAGVYNIGVVGAVQTDKNNNVALSAGIVRNCSTLVTIKRKTNEEIVQDGIECGNTKLEVAFNRNGRHTGEDEYIDVNFIGDILTYEDSKKQHQPKVPY